MQKLTIISGLLKSSGAESTGAFLAYVLNLKTGRGLLNCPLCSPAGTSRSNFPPQSHGMFGLNAGEDIVLVAACSRAVKKGRRPVAVNSLAGLPIYQRDRAVVIRFEDIRVIRLHMEPPVRIVVPPQPRTFRKYCAQSERTATSPSCKQSSAAQRGRDASEQRHA